MNLATIRPGDKFGKLEVIGQATSTANGNERYTCRCDCGFIPHAIRASELRNGNAESCHKCAGKQR